MGNVYIAYHKNEINNSVNEKEVITWFPANTTPTRAREPSPLRWKQNYRVVDLLVNYICLLFNPYF